MLEEEEDEEDEEAEDEDEADGFFKRCEAPIVVSRPAACGARFPGEGCNGEAGDRS